MAILMVGCADPAGFTQERTRTFPVGDLVFTEVGEADLVAVDAASGKVRFRYHYEGIPKVPFARARAPVLLCAPVVLPDRVVLRYDESVHVLARPGGELMWQRECLPTACPAHCAAVLPDGEVAVLTESGRSLTLLQPGGRDRWTRSLGATAVEAPVVAADRFVVRTRTGLVALGRDGAVAWQEAARPYLEAPLPKGVRPTPPSR
jgi:hypothetical protein